MTDKHTTPSGPTGYPGPGENHRDSALLAMIECAAVQAALQTTATVRQRSLQDFLR